MVVSLIPVPSRAMARRELVNDLVAAFDDVTREDVRFALERTLGDCARYEEAARSALAAEERSEAHLAACPPCRAGRPCAEGARLGSEEALARRAALRFRAQLGIGVRRP
jgi:hypothetical protein